MSRMAALTLANGRRPFSKVMGFARAQPILQCYSAKRRPEARALASLEGCAGKISPSPFETRARARSSGWRLLITRLRVPDVEFSQRAGNDKIIVVEHQGPRDTVLEKFKRHRINRRLL